jgi:hypothetical protein
LSIRPDKFGDMRSAELELALKALGETLATRGLTARLAVVGGGALLLIGELERPTRDLDVVAQLDEQGYLPADPLPSGLNAAVADVGRALGLDEDWLNPGPTALLQLGLPDGFAERTEVRRYGSLELHLASRHDQIHFKLYAAVDQGPSSKHTSDLAELEPTRDELLTAAQWARTHEPSEALRAELIRALAHFGIKAAHEHL